MKQIRNPEYNKWCRKLRRWAMDYDFYWEEHIDEHCSRKRPFTVTQILNWPDENVLSWLALNPMPAKTIDDPEYVAMQERINVLEKENSDLKQGTGIDIHKFLLDWHKNHDALSLDDVSFIVDKFLLYMRIDDLINTTWSVAEEDKHYYTDKGLKVPFNFMGSDDDYHMSMLSVYIDRFKASRNKTREQRYYECLQADIDKRLKDKEAHK